VKFFPLVFANLRRKWWRTLFTLLAIVVAFALYGVLMSVRSALSGGVEAANADRLVVRQKVSLIQPLPLSYQEQLGQVPGVQAVAHANWFGGIYQEPKNFFPQIAVDPQQYLDLFPEFVLPPEQKKAWIADRTGAIVGRATAERFGFEVGDRIPIQGTFNRKAEGPNVWEFTLDGIYTGAKKNTDTSQFLFHYDFLNEAKSGPHDLVGWYIVRIADPAQAAAVADRIDATFANSAYETKTATEQAFAQSFADQVGNIAAIVSAIVSAVFFTLLLVAGNTMAQAVRERTNELAVLRTLGFTNRRVMVLVLAESLLMALLGGALGLLLAGPVVAVLAVTMRSFLPVLYLPGRAVALGSLFVLLLGLAAGLVPAIQANRLEIVDALRKV
jgi:putative ABC transport system permease protein